MVFCGGSFLQAQRIKIDRYKLRRVGYCGGWVGYFGAGFSNIHFCAQGWVTSGLLPLKTVVGRFGALHWDLQGHESLHELVPTFIATPLFMQTAKSNLVIHRPESDSWVTQVRFQGVFLHAPSQPSVGSCSSFCPSRRLEVPSGCKGLPQCVRNT